MIILSIVLTIDQAFAGSTEKEQPVYENHQI